MTLLMQVLPAAFIRVFRVLLCRLTLTPWDVRAQINIEYNIRCVRYMFSNFAAIEGIEGWHALGWSAVNVHVLGACILTRVR